MRLDRLLAYSVLAVFLVFLTGIPSQAQARPLFGAEPGSSLTVADFDGDLKPDVAQSKPLGYSNGGYLYRILLQLSSRTSADLFTFYHGDALGLRIDAIDADGDHDLDLAVGGRFETHDERVFINNGHGYFNESSRDGFYDVSFDSSPEWQQPHITAENIQDSPPRTPDCLAPSYQQEPRPQSTRQVCSISGSTRQDAARFAVHYLRAPPRSTLF
jgi:hypothetical protein